MSRALTITAFVGLFALLCALGSWQLSRAQEKRERFEAFTERFTAPAVDLDLLDGPLDPARDRWRRVDAHGRYGTTIVLLDNRIKNGTAGYEVLTALETATGTTLLVNRGWVALAGERSRVPDVAAPPGPVTLSGYLGPPPVVGLELGEERGAVERLGATVLRVQHAEPARLSVALDLEFAPLVLYLDADAPGALDADFQTPGDGSARHRAYAVQWFAMAAVLALIGFAIVRRHGTGLTAPHPPPL